MTDRQKPRLNLPLHAQWESEKQYVEAVLTFATTSDLFRNLCGGVHILDFLTSEPDFYKKLLPQDWRDFFEQIEIWDVLRFVLKSRELLVAAPPSLAEYLSTIRRLCLLRGLSAGDDDPPPMPRHIAVGMKPKKIHEVSHFASYVDRLAAKVATKIGEPVTLVDFGSGQNYLGRTLACPPYNKDVIAIERKHHNVQGARGMDVHAKLAKKKKIMRNKKEYKKKLATFEGLPTPPPEELEATTAEVPDHVLKRLTLEQIEEPGLDQGSMTYIEHDIKDGNLEPILRPALPKKNVVAMSSVQKAPSSDRKLMTISLHSCGNLSHHAIRSLALTPSVSAITIIGCCYNLLTERLGPVSYKLPSLRPNHPRLTATSSAYDPHGFPMSKYLEDFPLPDGGKGVRLNITARMMAVQAPYNWGQEDSEIFFTRHFYRALLQRILLDRGLIKQATLVDDVVGGNSLPGKDEINTPLIVGSLRIACFTSFRTYVRGALKKLSSHPTEGEFIRKGTIGLSDEVIDEYEVKYAYAKKNLSVIWTLMAFSAGVVESIIAIDRWLYLKEQECMEEAWVEPVFDYALSPRNLCVVGIKVDTEGV
jgi:Methyltransferase domain